MIIDSTYFIDEINVINGEDDSLSRFIAKYEPKFLEMLFGKDMADAFLLGLEEDVIEERWVSLRDELRNETTLESPIANFIYRKISDNRADYAGHIGNVRPKTENSTVVFPIEKVVRAWNEMIEQSKEVIDFVEENIGDYPEYEEQEEIEYIHRVDI